jgi:ribonuclease T2
MAWFRRGLGAALFLACGNLAALAEMPAAGEFIATSACPALQSIRKETNPGEVMTEPGSRYAIIAKNRKKATHYRIDVPDADPPERWVEARCGKIEMAEAPKKKTGQPKSGAAKSGPSYVLAISWQPAFCEGNSRKPECRSQTGSRFDATHFTLHGLWPQPGTNIYCGVSEADRRAATDGRWRDLPRLALSLATERALAEAMPGSQSFLDRYEWVKHGTCHPSGEPEAYYRDSLRLIAAINDSPVRDLFAANIGRAVSMAEIRARFDEAFGPGAGERVRMSCRDDGSRRLIAELTIGLRGDVSGGTPVSDLILASSPTEEGCPRGIVDPVGLQ